jgi:amino acid adenylation domain-containing protein
MLAEITPLDLPPMLARNGRPTGRLSAELRFAPAWGSPLACAPGETSLRDAASVLFAALATLLHRYTGQSHLVAGLMSASDTRPLALRLAVDGELAFRELLERVEAAIGATQGLGELRLDEPTNGVPEPRVVLGLDCDPPAEGEHDVWLSARRSSDELVLKLYYSGEVEDRPMADRVLRHLERILEEIEADPGQRISEMQLLPDSERMLLLEDWQGPSTAYPSRCLHELIADRARETPDAVAVVYEGEHLTYGELEARANRLGRHLGELGVGRETLVGICVERSAEMLVGLLGILKAGAAYVPIDPTYPAARQAFMLTNSQAPVVVTQESLLEHLPQHECVTVCLDRDWPAIQRLSPDPPDVACDPEELAYVIYTSGSTGTPKGVEIPHRALVNFMTTMSERPGLGAEDVLLAVTTLSFDIAGLELWLPLVVGARVVVAPTAAVADPRALAALLAANDVTVMQATPTSWRMLVDAGWEGRPGLKALCGGEALPLALADELVARGLELWNMYGPTETTIWSTIARIEVQGGPLTIGRPIGNTSLYILDADLRPVPIGLPGELYIGGHGLARGYRGRPDLTEERFIAHPFDQTPSARIYRTGDLARYGSDGRVEYLGRIDDQVKVRGYRIELGEIENVLVRHPAVSRSVAVARTDDRGERELVAYFIPKGIPVSSSTLRRYLRQALPDYMVPDVVVSVEAFPLTPNGKIDRKALPAPRRERGEEEEYVAPRTALERRLVEIWERELDIRPISVTENFFDLGVRSIVAAQLFARIEHELGSRLPLGAVFHAPTIESLAHLLEVDHEAARWKSLVPIQPHGSLPPIFCVHGGAGTILHLEPLARHLGDEQPFYGLQQRGLYGGAPSPRSVEAMAAQYLTEVRSVRPHGPFYLAGYCFGAIVAFHMAQMLVQEGEEVPVLAMFNGPSPSWIRAWAAPDNQPSRRGGRVAQARGPRPAVHLRIARAAPAFFRGSAREVIVRLALATRRPLPERLRENHFLRLNAKAERAYEPRTYPGRIWIFYGQGLYEDPNLGWGGLAEGGLETYAIPGEHSNNRQMMNEPYVHFVGDRLRTILAGGLSSAGARSDGRGSRSS